MGNTADSLPRVAVLSLCFAACALAAANTTTTLTTSGSPAMLGHVVTIAATVAPNTVTGKVTFYDGASVLGISALNSGSATWTTVLLTTGPHVLTARYGGDPNNAQSLSAPASLVVQSLAASAVQAGAPFDTGSSYRSAASADFNHDGKVDLVGLDTASELHVMLGNGNGTFTSAASYPNVSTFLVGDFDGDGNTDLAIANQISPSFSIFLGNGDGTFRTGPVTVIPGVNAAVNLGLTADLNGDGVLDVLVFDSTSLIAYALNGAGDGSFLTRVALSGVIGLPATAGDFNADGKIDVFTANGLVFLGNGDGTFATGYSVTPELNAVSLTTVDINGDGKLDVVASDGGTVTTFLGNGDGTFQVVGGPIENSSPLFVIDFDGDGKADVVAYGSVAIGNGNGTFQSFVPIPGAQGAETVLAADFNGNGQVDLIGTSLSTSVYLGTYSGTAVVLSAGPNPATYGQPLTLTAVVTPATATGSVSFYSGSTLIGASAIMSGVASLTVTANSSGRQVLTATYPGDAANQPAVSVPLTVTVNGTASAVSLAASSANLAYGQTVTLTATVAPRSAPGSVTFYDGSLAIAVEPLASGKAVFATAALGTGAHSITAQYDAGASYSISQSSVVALDVTSAAAGAFTPGTATLPNLRYSVIAVDLNHDGRTDLAGLDQEGNVAVLIDTGNGTFAAPILYPVGTTAWTLLAADVNGDGNPDIVVGNGFNIAVLFGNGDGTLRTGPLTTFQTGLAAVFLGELIAGDLNGDGKIDLLLFTFNGATTVLLGNGDGTFDVTTPANLPPSGNGAVAGDFNGDGKLDCIFVPAGFESLDFAAGNGDGTFQSPVTLVAESITGPLAAADLNGDGKLDLVAGVLTQYGFGIGVLLGNGNGTFGSMTVYPGNSPNAILIADFNGDGKPDLLLSSYLPALYFGNGDGTFTSGSNLSEFTPVATGSFSSYGAVDVVAVGGNGVDTIELGIRPSTLTVTASPNPGTLGKPVTLTGTVTPANATGTVTFYDGLVTVLGTAPVTGGIATFTTSSLAANRHSISASYSGDAITAISYSYNVSLLINGQTSAVTLSAPASPLVYGQPIKLSATVTPSSATGEVTFFEGVKILGSSLLASGSATFTTPLLDSGPDSIRAVYAGSSTFTAGSASNSAVLQVNALPGGAFIPVVLPVQPSTYLVNDTVAAVGDFNQDGISDLLLVTSEQVCAYLGNGDGTFRQSWCGPAGDFTTYLPPLVVIADFNSDGIPDFFISGSGNPSDTPLLFTGNGDGTFSAASILAPYIFDPQALATADMNLDGIPDLVGYGNELSVELSNGDGAFLLSYGTSITYPPGVASMVVADFNADGKPDVAVAGNDPENVTVFLGNGDGTLQSPTNFVAGNTPTLMITADFNHDGKPDLAVITGSPTSGLNILLGNGNGSFQAPLTYSAMSGVLSIANGDFNGDGNPDLVITNNTIVSVYYGNGDGTFQTPVETNVPLPYLAVGDFNGDGRTDLAGLLGALPATITVTAPTGQVSLGQSVTLTATVSPSSLSGTVTFYDGTTPLGTVSAANGTATLTTTIPGSDLQQISAVFHTSGAYDSPSSPVLPVSVTAGVGGAFSAPVNYPVGSSPSAVVTGDFNGDGRPDLAVANMGSNNVTVLYGQANGTFGNAQTLATGSQPVALAAGDVDGDGVSDLIVGIGGASSSLAVFLSRSGTLLAGATIPLSSTPAAVLAADMNHDGKLDVLVSCFGSSLLLFGNGDGTFTADPNSFFGGGGIATGDFNGDGYPDFFTTGFVYFGDGTAQFSGLEQIFALSTLVVAGDFNGDGKLDIATGGGSNVAIDLGKGDGTFQPSLSFPTSSIVTSIASGDFNGDGKLDIVLTTSDGKAGVMFGNGDGTLQLDVEFAAGTQPSALAVGDFNHDGILDLAMANAGSNTVSILSGVPSTCTYATSVAPDAFDSSGGIVTLKVTTNLPTCSWNATATETYSDQFDPPQVASGIGNGSAEFSVPTNQTGADATDTIELNGQQQMVTVEATVTQFQDVPPGAFAFDAINLLKRYNVTDGCTATDFCPTDSVTRADMALFIIRAIFDGNVFPYPATQIFTDVAPSNPGYQAIQELSALGITDGCGGGNFCPDDTVTRAQMAAFIIRARYGATTIFPFNPVPYFTDVPVGSFAFADIQRMEQDGITTGCGSGMFCPDQTIPRDQMALFLMRGLFNQLLPPGLPFVVSSPLGCPVESGGTASCLVIAPNPTFDQTTLLSAPGGLTFSNLQVITATMLEFEVTAPSGITQLTPESLLITTGTQLLVAPEDIAVQSAP